MIEACFNELSMYPVCQTDEEVGVRINAFVELLKGLKSLGIKFVRYENSFDDICLKENLSLREYCQGKESQVRTQADFLYGTMRRPYMEEDEEEMFFKYTKAAFILKKGGKDFPKDCLGLYVALLKQSFAVGFNAGDFAGDRHKICTIRLTKKDGQCVDRQVCCLTQKEHIMGVDEFVELMSNQPDLPVEKCGTDESQKKCHLSDHHGMKECEEHAKSLLKNEYVKEVLNSIDHKSSERQYIHRVDNHNLIDVRLYWTQKGYGLCISTTATNKIQNYWIAKQLNFRYGQK